MRTRIVAFILVAMIGLTAFLSTTVPSQADVHEIEHAALASDSIPANSSNPKVDSSITYYMTQLTNWVHAVTAYEWYKTLDDNKRAEEARHENQARQGTPRQSEVSQAPGDIWSCIISHESGGDPTAYNSSSGAAGIYQFELGTWLSPSIISITGNYPGGAATAPASVQTAAAISYQAQNGWGAWRGDGCTPLG